MKTHKILKRLHLYLSIAMLAFSFSLLPQNALGMHGKFHLNQIDVLIQKYGMPLLIDVIFSTQNGSITIFYKDLIIEKFPEKPSEFLVNAETIAQDLKRLNLDLIDFENHLKKMKTKSHSPAHKHIQLKAKSNEKEGSKKRLEILYQKQLRSKNRLNLSVDRRVQNNLRRITSISEKLLYASQQAHIKSVAELIEKGADVNCQDENGVTPLMEVANYRHYSSDSQSPLKVAILLIKAGADINAQKNHKRSAISLAIEMGRVDMAELLLREGATVENEEPRVISLVTNRKKEMLRWLVHVGVGLEFRSLGRTPLLWALKDYHHPTIGRLLVHLGADLCVVDDQEQTALMYSLENKDINIFRTILDRCGEDAVTKRSTNKSTVLHIAVSKLKQGHTALLLGAGADIKAKDLHGRTPLHLTAKNRDKYRVQKSIATAKLLLDAGAPVNATDSNGNTPLILAAEYGLPEYIGFLFENGADLLKINKTNMSAAFVMATRGRSAALQEILKIGKETGNTKPLLKDRTPLIAEAIARNNPEAAMVLISCGADIEKRTRSGDTPLIMAAGRNEAFSVAKYLIEKGANINAQNNAKESALMVSIMRQTYDISSLLIENGANIELLDQNGQSAMHWAAKWTNIHVQNRLIKLNIDLNGQDKFGVTPLMVADNLAVARVLVNAGANTELKDKRERTALDHAKLMHRNKIVSFLQKEDEQ